MTSTKSFSTKNAGVLVVAVFTIVVSLGLSQVSSAMALNELLNCDTEVDNESSKIDMKEATSCNDEDNEESNKVESKSDDNDTVSSNDVEGDNENNGAETKANSVIKTGPAVASPDDNIIKPINLNKGGESDEPLEVNGANNKQTTADSVSKQVFEDEMDLGDQLSKNTNADVSELYESFDLPYTAIYKNQ